MNKKIKFIVSTAQARLLHFIILWMIKTEAQRGEVNYLRSHSTAWVEDGEVSKAESRNPDT